MGLLDSFGSGGSVSVPVVYVILMSDEIIKLPFTIKRFFSYKWLRDVTRDDLADVS